MREGTNLYSLFSNHLPLMVAITDDSGSILSEQRYMPFGEARDVGTEITETDFGYTGQRDLGMGLMDYRARFYDAAIGRFLQPDTDVPASQGPQGLNRYAYVNNAPINNNDPTGHSLVEKIKKLKHGYGKHAWKERGASKYWNRTGKLLDFTPDKPAEPPPPPPPVMSGADSQSFLGGWDKDGTPSSNYGCTYAGCNPGASTSASNPFMPVNIRLNGTSEDCAPGFLVSLCFSITSELISSSGSPITVDPTSVTLGTAENGSITGNPLTGTFTYWAPTTELTRGNVSIYNRVGIEGSYTNTTRNRWQFTQSVNNGNVSANTRINLTVGYDPNDFRKTIAVGGSVISAAASLYGMIRTGYLPPNLVPEY